MCIMPDSVDNNNTRNNTVDFYKKEYDSNRGSYERMYLHSFLLYDCCGILDYK